MAKRRKSSRRGKWCRTSKKGRVLGHHRTKKAAQRARRKGQRVRKC